ncbi:MAG TPA: D-alanine--D-alanine ligase [Fibrobacteria bacterium]|nr:D-alanine--D-alanine ligase [Fibrobacteria bacterium]HOX51393.1 D-alanine--D-alanine ligase [Fibrobacteria bacterium]
MTKTVLVLMGGYSTEHDVSLKSGTGVVRQMDPSLYQPWPVVLTRDRRWRFPPRPLAASEQPAFEGGRHDLAAGDLSDGWSETSGPALERLPCDGAFLALHGDWGEDGRMQSLLEFHGVHYTGSGVLGSATAMDKSRTKEILATRDIPIAPSMELSTDMGPESFAERAFQWGELPLVLKVPTGGSSIGVHIVRTEEQLVQAAVKLCAAEKRVLVEKFVSGRELTCGVLEGHAPLPPTEIRPKCGEFFDFSSKYLPGGSEEITPAVLPEETTRQIQDLARRVHETLRLRAYSRTDFILGEDGPIVLEVNTLPGMTETSLIPQQAAAIGLSYRDLVTAILRASWDKP